MREPKKRERLRFSLATLLPIDLLEPTKLDQSRLLRMEFQRKGRQPFPKFFQEPLGVFALLEADHQIVGVAGKHHLSARHLPAPCFNPQVEFAAIGILSPHYRPPSPSMSLNCANVRDALVSGDRAH